jgi:hypothetical protein
MKSYTLQIQWQNETFINTFQADDLDHAIEQAENAYPSCMVIDAQEATK